MTSDRIGRRSRGFTLLGVGPLLLLAFSLKGPAAFPDGFPLFPTFGNEGAAGRATLTQVWSPFGVSVDEDGNVEYELAVSVSGLPEIDGESYRVWLTTPTLEEIVDFGIVPPDGEVRGFNEFRQLMVVVSREPSARKVAPGERWEGPIVLRGFSAGARVTPLGQHSLFQPSPM